MGTSRRFLLADLLSIWLAIFFAFPAIADTSDVSVSGRSLAQPVERDSADRLDRLTNTALSKIIDFERWYWQQRAITSKEPRWRHLRWFVMQDAAAGLFLSSQISMMREAARGMTNPEKVSTPELRKANVCGLLGSAFEGGSSALELGSNALIAAKNKRRGNDPATSKRIAMERLDVIDSFLAQRADLTVQLRSSNDFPAYECEGKLLKACRDRCALEFADLYGDTKAYQSSNNIYYVLDVAGCSTYVASYVLALKGLRDVRYNGPSIITAIVADVVFVPAAQVYSYSYKWLYKHSRNRFLQDAKQQDYDAHNKAREILLQLKANSEGVTSSAAPSVAPSATSATAKISAELTDRLSKRLAIYELWAKTYDTFISKKQLDLNRLERVARQSNISGPAIAGAFLAADIIGLNANYRLMHNARASNANVFAGGVATTLASTVDLGFTTGWYCGDLVHNHNLRKRQALPEQLIQQRIRTADELDAIMAAKSVP